MQSPVNETTGNSHQFFEVTAAADVPPGERLFIETDDKPIIIFNIDGDFFAVDDECTHDNGPLSDGELDGFCVACPRHGAVFDVRTGQVKALPAVKNISAYPVRVTDGMIEIGIVLEE